MWAVYFFLLCGLSGYEDSGKYWYEARDRLPKEILLPGLVLALGFLFTVYWMVHQEWFGNSTKKLSAQ